MASPSLATELARARLTSQRIVGAPAIRGGTGAEAVADTARHLVATQAQDFAQAVWALGLRTPGSRRSDVLGAMENGSIVRTAPMRGTLHFVAAEDLHWLLRLTSVRTVASAATRFRGLGLDDYSFTRAAAIARDVLTGRGLSRDEFMKALESGGVSTDGQRGYHIIFWLSQHAVVCWGPPRGNQQALVLVDEWVRPTQELARDAAVQRFVLRYFASHGPATLKDFVWWSKLTVTDARAGLAAVRDRLTGVEWKGETYWALAPDGPGEDRPRPAASRALNSVILLPGFDEYLLGYQDRSLTLPAEFATAVAPGANGIFLPIIVSRGQVVGTWKRPSASPRQDAVAQPFGALSDTEKGAFERAVRTYSLFMLG